MLASSLIGGGMNWWQAILTIFLGNTIVLIPMILNGHAGAKYGIPFPVFARASFGIKGANIPAMLQGNCCLRMVWYSNMDRRLCYLPDVSVWIPRLPKSTTDLPAISLQTGPDICFFLFWLLNMFVVYLGVESIRKLLVFKAIFLPLAALALLFWAISAANGLGPILEQPSKFHEPLHSGIIFFPALTGMVGFWATLIIKHS